MENSIFLTDQLTSVCAQLEMIVSRDHDDGDMYAVGYRDALNDVCGMLNIRGQAQPIGDWRVSSEPSYLLNADAA